MNTSLCPLQHSLCSGCCPARAPNPGPSGQVQHAPTAEPCDLLEEGVCLTCSGQQWWVRVRRWLKG